MLKKSLLLSGVIFFAGLASVSKADEISELKELIIEQNKQIQQLQERLDKLESQQQQQKNELSSKISEVAAQKSEAVLPESLSWAENIKFGGEFRYRHESIDEER